MSQAQGAGFAAVRSGTEARATESGHEAGFAVAVADVARELGADGIAAIQAVVVFHGVCVWYRVLSWGKTTGIRARASDSV